MGGYVLEYGFMHKLRVWQSRAEHVALAVCLKQQWYAVDCEKRDSTRICLRMRLPANQGQARCSWRCVLRALGTTFAYATTSQRLEVAASDVHVSLP